MKTEAVTTPTPNRVQYGPLIESNRLTAGLDYYKPTMSQLVYELEPQAEVTFTFKNRGQQRLLDYVDAEALKERLDSIAERGWDQSELDYLGQLKSNDGKPVFNADYLDFLNTSCLPSVKVDYDPEIDDLEIEVTGPWALCSFWETIVMSEVNELYFESYMIANGLDPLQVYAEGDNHLDNKIAILKANPQIKFTDSGTRRRFSLRWQKHVLERLSGECPENLFGTSNIQLARSLGMMAIGTFAHEMPMVYAGLADARGTDIRQSHHEFLEAWFNRYGHDLATALTDTFSSDFFFKSFTSQQAADWPAVRHDSGDPFEFGERLIKFYRDLNIEPCTKTVVFSDGLDIDTILALQEAFSDNLNVVFGWGTDLTNDLGLPALNIVMKATGVRLPATDQKAKLVKLSDNPIKHTGPADKIELYKSIFKPQPESGVSL